MSTYNKEQSFKKIVWKSLKINGMQQPSMIKTITKNQNEENPKEQIESELQHFKNQITIFENKNHKEYREVDFDLFKGIK